MRCENCYDTVAEMIAAKDAEIARLNSVVAAMTDTAEESNRSYIDHHNKIQDLQEQLEANKQFLEDAKRYQFAQAKADCQVCVCMWDEKLGRWIPFSSKDASDYYIDRVIKEQP